jgi:hypothetical protein
MKNLIKKFSALVSIAIVAFGIPAMAQDQQMQYFRPNNGNGINTFETTKSDTTSFRKMKVFVGGNFEQEFQGLRDQNTAISVIKTVGTVKGNVNNLTGLTDGFDLAMANMNLDAQLDDGVRVSLSLYLSARHHEETWVKGGYIQFDKLTFLHSKLIDTLMKSFTIKIGQFDVDYGDQHFQRSDGGNTIYNPFIENYIMDEFATELGGELYYHHKSGFFAMAGVTNGELDPTALAPTKIDSATGKTNVFDAAFHAKIGYDKQLSKDFRLRASASVYEDQSGNSITLFGGDRTGSHYYGIMSNPTTAAGSTLSNANDYNPFAGRVNPGFSEELNAYMVNLFLQYKGLQLFGTYESANGRSITEKTTRNASQYAADLIYRFSAGSEKFWIGGRYNSMTAAIVGNTGNITVDREAASIGWFLTKNIMLKVEYVNQTYNGYNNTNILNGGRFDGWVAEASIAF